MLYAVFEFCLFVLSSQQVTFGGDDDDVALQGVCFFIVLAHSLKQQSMGSHVALLRYIIIIMSQPIFVPST